METKPAVKKLCPHCKQEVDPKASRCPHCHGKISQWGKRKIIVVVVLILLIVGIMNSIVSSSTPSTTSTPSTSFSTQARAHFDDVLRSSPELAAINCEGSDCGSVVYFDYKTIPDDVDFVIRGNAATFSKFKLDNTGVSHVTIAARYNGVVFKSCDADHGKVSECQNYSN